MLAPAILTSMLLVPAMAQADWCRWVPWSSQQYVPACRGYVHPYGGHDGGYGGYGCANWCQWVPGPSWGYTSGCAGCYGQYSRHYKALTVQSTTQLQIGCHQGCQWVSRPTWTNTSDCNQCEQPMVLESKTWGAQSTSKTGLKVKMLDTQQNDWCKWVPLGSLQYVDECKGAKLPEPALGGARTQAGPWLPATSRHYTFECSFCHRQSLVVPNQTGCWSWCEWVPLPSWEHTPDCSQCGLQPMPTNITNQTAAANVSKSRWYVVNPYR